MSKPLVVLPAAGASSRFFPFNRQHKSYLSVGGKALISQTMSDLIAQGFTEFVVIVGQQDPDGQHLQQLLQHDGVTVEPKIVTQIKPLGLGDALLQAQNYLLDQPFLVVTPYHLTAGRWAEELWEVYQESNSQGVVLSSETDTPELYGILQLDGHRITGVIEKPTAEAAPSNLRIRGMYLLHPDFMRYLQAVPAQEYSFEAALTQMAQELQLLYKKTTDPEVTLKYPWHLLSFMDTWLTYQEGAISSEAHIAATAIIDDSEGPVIIEPTAKVNDFAKLVGPCFIGRGALVGEYSFIRGSMLEPQTQVGANTEVVRSLLLNGCTIHSAFLADSILGEEAKVGAGCITANKRFDRRNVQIEIKGERIDSYRRNLGVMVGSKAQLGIGCKTMPGTIVGPDHVIEPGAIIKGNNK